MFSNTGGVQIVTNSRETTLRLYSFVQSYVIFALGNRTEEVV